MEQNPKRKTGCLMSPHAFFYTRGQNGPLYPHQRTLVPRWRRVATAAMLLVAAACSMVSVRPRARSQHFDRLMAALGAAEMMPAAAFLAGAGALTVDSLNNLRRGRLWMLCASGVNSTVGGAQQPQRCCNGSRRRRQQAADRNMPASSRMAAARLFGDVLQWRDAATFTLHMLRPARALCVHDV